MPCGQFEAKGIFFRIGVLAYNIYRSFILKTLNKYSHWHQVQTVRWRLYQIAGKIVFHGGQVFLKVGRHFCPLFDEVRLSIWEFANILSSLKKSSLLEFPKGQVCLKYAGGGLESAVRIERHVQS